MKPYPYTILILLLSHLYISNITAQDCVGHQTYIKKDSDLFFGCIPPQDEPEIFAEGVISTDQYEFAITFSADGNDIFFTRRSSYEKSNNNILHATYSNESLSYPKLAPFARSGNVELAPYCAPDVLKVYFHSDRNHPETGKRMTNDEKIWYSLKNENGWSEPEFLKGIINTGWVMGIAAANGGNLFLCGEVKGIDGILSSKNVKGNYPKVEKCFNGVHPYISPKEDYIIYDVIMENWEETELYIRFRNSDGNWGDELRLPSTINATKTESFGRVSPDGKYLFFQRNGDIYWVAFQEVYDDLKNQN